MSEERPIREKLADFGPIIDQLVDVVNTARKAFIHQRGQLLAQLNNQQDPLCREIGSAMMQMYELSKSKTSGERESCLRVHSILTHLRIIAETTCRLEETLQNQIRSGVLFSDKAVSEVCHLFNQQSDILSNLANIIRKDSEDSRHHVMEECKKLAHTCLQFGTEHETRLVEGLCFPQSAPLFLDILDQVQTIAYHEREIGHLLGNNF